MPKDGMEPIKRLQRGFLVSRFPNLVSLLPLLLMQSFPSASIAQVTSAGNATGTIVTQTGNEYTVTGGILSGDGGNLFHNFSDFNLTSSQSANFLANPSIQNILSRISGGNPSYIDGLISVSNSNANLFLLNSSGLIFGSNAQLNVAGDFTASTAMGLGFSDEI